jgi:hypothetical protein
MMRLQQYRHKAVLPCLDVEVPWLQAAVCLTSRILVMSSQLEIRSSQKDICYNPVARLTSPVKFQYRYQYRVDELILIVLFPVYNLQK